MVLKVGVVNKMDTYQILWIFQPINMLDIQKYQKYGYIFIKLSENT